MFKYCTLILLVTLWSTTPSVHAASRWSKRQIDLTNLNSNAGQLSTSSYQSEGSQVNALEDNKIEPEQIYLNVNIDDFEEEWRAALRLASKRLGEAFERYDEAKATMKGDIKALAKDVKDSKQDFDRQFYLYLQKFTELQLNRIH